MAARVAAARDLPVSGELTANLTDDVARVRGAAARALGAVGAASDFESLHALLKDTDIDVRRAAQQGIDALRARSGAATP